MAWKRVRTYINEMSMKSQWKEKLFFYTKYEFLPNFLREVSNKYLQSHKKSIVKSIWIVLCLFHILFWHCWKNFNKQIQKKKIWTMPIRTNNWDVKSTGTNWKWNFFFQKLFWPTVRMNCSNIQEKLGPRIL